MKKQKPENCEKLLIEPTVSLIQRIVCDSDRLALKVLLETRKLFYTREKSGLSIIQFLIGLREKLMPSEQCNSDLLEIADCAYDLTLAKYTNFSNPPTEKSKANTSCQRGDRVDCRLYYL